MASLLCVCVCFLCCGCGSCALCGVSGVLASPILLRTHFSAQAFPFSDGSDATVSEQTNELFRIVHVGNFNTTVQALSLLFQVASTKPELQSRYYRTLYVLCDVTACCVEWSGWCVRACATTPV